MSCNRIHSYMIYNEVNLNKNALQWMLKSKKPTCFKSVLLLCFGIA
ncbi:hypothetical protein QW060_09230 [Myroides ceti]|uniref:Uncharacterized protein n=1 Tax=Paenimyroides ceti TaxID=395087 RepID=A0ABT8CVW9_9FLAO|nr:hypothetical protein [Paenimyroides ceti]MDN3707317.1 hypothetical protein [Paenimyroides ceti]